MKRLCMACAVLLAGSAVAQEFVSPGPTESVVDETPIVIDADQRRVAVEGIVADIFNVKKPWQLVNPAAPEEYGDGRSNGTVSYSEEDPGKPKGFIVLAVEY